MIAVVLYTKKVVEGVSTPGVLLYPSSQGQFKSKEEEASFAALFTGNAPSAPYAGAGKRFGNSLFSEAELREAKLEHMERNFSKPKNIATFWEADEKAQTRLAFPLCTPVTTIMPHENAKSAAGRVLWEFTGIKTKDIEFEKKHDHVSIFKTFITIDAAKWEWMTHQAERMTLTDWDVCPHMTLLTELGVPSVVYQSYCQTHGGPRFVVDTKDHRVHADTMNILNAVDMVYCSKNED